MPNLRLFQNAFNFDKYRGKHDSYGVYHGYPQAMNAFNEISSPEASTLDTTPVARGATWPTEGTNIRTDPGRPYAGLYSLNYRKNKDGSSRPHWGVDILQKEGDPVYTAMEGKVSRVGWQTDEDHKDGFGYRVWIDTNRNGNEYKIAYSHLDPDSVKLKKGDWLVEGQYFADQGRTGNLTNEPTYLHFEVKKKVDGKWKRVPPSEIFSKEDKQWQSIPRTAIEE